MSLVDLVPDAAGARRRATRRRAATAATWARCSRARRARARARWSACRWGSRRSLDYPARRTVRDAVLFTYDDHQAGTAFQEAPGQPNRIRCVRDGAGSTRLPRPRRPRGAGVRALRPRGRPGRGATTWSTATPAARRTPAYAGDLRASARARGGGAGARPRPENGKVRGRRHRRSLELAAARRQLTRPSTSRASGAGSGTSPTTSCGGRTSSTGSTGSSRARSCRATRSSSRMSSGRPRLGRRAQPQGVRRPPAVRGRQARRPRRRSRDPHAHAGRGDLRRRGRAGADGRNLRGRDRPGSRPRGREQLAAADALRQRAGEINDEIVQRLVLAAAMLDRGETERAGANMAETLTRAKSIAADLIIGADGVEPGALRRSNSAV